MTREYGRKWDGVSRIPDDAYRKNWQDIFGKKEKVKKKKEKEENNESTDIRSTD